MEVEPCYQYQNENQNAQYAQNAQNAQNE